MVCAELTYMDLALARFWAKPRPRLERGSVWWRAARGDTVGRNTSVASRGIFGDKHWGSITPIYAWVSHRFIWFRLSVCSFAYYSLSVSCGCKGDLNICLGEHIKVPINPFITRSSDIIRGKNGEVVGDTCGFQVVSKWTVRDHDYLHLKVEYNPSELVTHTCERLAKGKRHSHPNLLILATVSTGHRQDPTPKISAQTVMV